MAFKIIGRVTFVGPAQTLLAKSGNSYTKRDFVITVRRFDPNTGQPSDDEGNTPKFSFMGDNCSQLDNIKVDDIVEVQFNIYGRCYDKDGKTEYFTEVRPFRVDVVSAPANRMQQPVYQVPQQPYGQHTPYPQQPSYPPQPQQYVPAPSQAPQAYQPPNQPIPTPFGQNSFPPAPNELQGKTEELPF